MLKGVKLFDTGEGTKLLYHGDSMGLFPLDVINEGLMWVDIFLNPQFIVIYKRAFNLILSEEDSFAPFKLENEEYIKQIRQWYDEDYKIVKNY